MAVWFILNGTWTSKYEGAKRDSANQGEFMNRLAQWMCVFFALAIIAPCGAFEAGDKLTDQMVKDILTKHFAKASSSSSQIKLELHAVKVNPARKVTSKETSDFGLPADTTVYPVKADYSQTLTLGNRTTTQEIEGFFIFYKDGHGGWAFFQLPPGSKQ
jgi:hypothetical protein